MFVSLPYKEIIFGLRGYSGDFFVLDELEFENNLDKKLFDDSFGEANLDSLKRLCALAVQHKILLDYVQSIQGTCCNYERKFVAGITNSLKEFYEELSYLEDKREQLVTLCAFHSLFKYQAFFSDLVCIIKQIRSTSAIKLFETLNSRLKSTDLFVCKFYQIIFFHYKRALFDDLWNWLIFGCLDEVSNKFFIVASDDEAEIFKFTTGDLPCIEPALLRRILMHGKLIALFQAHHAIGWQQIFAGSLDSLEVEFRALCSSEEYREVQLTEFIKNATDVVLKFYSIHLIEKQNILSHLKLIKDTHLMGNHSFWMSFCGDLVKRIESKQFNRETDLSLQDINNCWLKNIREFYDEKGVNQFQAQVQIDEVRRSAVSKVPEKYKKFGQYSKVFFFPEISISYNLPAMVGLFLSKESFKKYDVLFNFLLKLHQTRMILNKLWFENLKNPSYDKRICLITMKLTSLIERLLFHYKVYIIEIGFCEFENEVKNCDNPSDLEQCHTKFIDRLLRESLVNIEGVHNQFLDLFAFCQKVYLTTNQTNLTDKEIGDLQSELNDLNSHFSLLFSSSKAHEISGSLKYLLN